MALSCVMYQWWLSGLTTAFTNFVDRHLRSYGGSDRRVGGVGGGYFHQFRLGLCHKRYL